MKTSLSRRHFLATAGAGSLSLIAARKALSSQARDRRVVVHTKVEIGTIRPELHGHFAEHLGTCIYGGLWVGRNSPIPNTNGYRKQAVEWLAELGIPVLRWPGGCFADDYHWRDGIGPAEKRPKAVNIWWGNAEEDNSFGTHEFIGLCKLIGAQPYLAGNVGTGTPRELRDWVEYSNNPSGSTLAEERAANGSREPFRVKYWGVGNENWGCGGHMRPEEYATHYRRFATFMRAYGDTRPFLIACGPSSNDLDWTRGFFDTLKLRRGAQIDGYAMHYYSGGKNVSTKFTVDNLREQLSTFDGMEKAALQQRALMDSYDPDRKIGLLIDEWGVWDRMVPEEQKRYGMLWQHITMRSAVAAALGLNVFHRQADKVIMGNIAQTVNVLHSLLLTYQQNCVRTTTYHAYALLKPHRSKASLRTETEDASPLGLSVSASRQGNNLVLTVVNPKHDEAANVRCALEGARAQSALGRILHDDDFNACNNFEAPDRIVPQNHPVTASGSEVTFALPPMSVMTAEVALG